MAPMTRSFSPNGMPGENVAAYYRRRAEGGIGLILSEGTVIDRPASQRFWEPKFSGTDGETGLNFAGWAKKLTGAATISVGSVGLSGDFIGSFGGEGATSASLDNLLNRMERDEFDLIAVGRAILNDPQWVEKIQTESDELKDFSPSALTELV